MKTKYTPSIAFAPAAKQNLAIKEKLLQALLCATLSFFIFSSNAQTGNPRLGTSALPNNNGVHNTALGYYSMSGNTTGCNNTATGSASLSSNTTGSANTASGYYSLANNTKGSGTDGRFKKNMKENVPGLEFIKQLRPLTYNYDVHGLNKQLSPTSLEKNISDNMEAVRQNEEAMNRKEKKTYTGFVAQEVEAAAKKSGYDFSGVYKPSNETDVYGISYSDFVVPLVKAVQELSKLNDEKDARIDGLQKQIDELKRIFLSTVENNSSSQATTHPMLAYASLEQNFPNPFINATAISYTLPQTFTTAQISITDKNGKMLKQVNVSGSGKWIVHLDAASFSSGSYNYSLFIDGRLISTKQMVLTK